jgi:hypothetical protein
LLKVLIPLRCRLNSELRWRESGNL